MELYSLPTIYLGPTYGGDNEDNGENEKKVKLLSYVWPHVIYSLPGSSVHVIFQVRILEWVAISFSI